MNERGDAGVLDPETALRQVQRARATTRGAVLTAGWLPLVIWGAVLLGGSLAGELLEHGSFWYWVVTIPAAAALSCIAGYRSSNVLRVDTPAWLYVVVGAAMFVVGFGVWGAMDEATAALVWWVGIAGGMALMSWLDKQHLLALALVAIGAWGVVLWMAVPAPEVLITLVAALGAALLAAGASLRMVRNEP